MPFRDKLPASMTIRWESFRQLPTLERISHCLVTYFVIPKNCGSGISSDGFLVTLLYIYSQTHLKRQTSFTILEICLFEFNQCDGCLLFFTALRNCKSGCRMPWLFILIALLGNTSRRTAENDG